MNQLQLIAVANCIPRDATDIGIESDEDVVTFYSKSGEPKITGYSELNRPMVHVITKHHRGANWSSWFSASAIIVATIEEPAK